MFKIALVDDHQLIRRGIATLINSFVNFEVILEAGNGKELLAGLQPDKLPDIVLLDITMPEMDGFETALWLKTNHPAIKVIALSVMDDEAAIIRMIKNGCCGYLLKNSKPEELKGALEAVSLNGAYVNDTVSYKLVHSIQKITDPEDDLMKSLNLNDREREFLKHLCSEKSHKEIGEAMFLSPRTIDSYRDSLFEKLNVKSRVGLVIFAIKYKVVEI